MCDLRSATQWLCVKEPFCYYNCLFLHCVNPDVFESYLTIKMFCLLCWCVCSGSRILQPAQVCDVLKGFIMVLCYFMMHYVDYSMMYHLIRGQSVIKLYIIYNMLEVQYRNTHICYFFFSFGSQ